MTKAELLLKLDELIVQRERILKDIKSINALEPIIEKRIIDGFKPVFDTKTGTELTKDNIDARISALATELTENVNIERPILVGVMNGAMPFVNDLYKRLNEKKYDCQLDALSASSYEGMESGDLVIKGTLKIPVVGRDVVLVDDVCDSGKTARKLKEHLEMEGANRVYLMVLVDKAQKRKEANAVSPDYVGFTVSKDAFIAGWGMDWEELLRGHFESIASVDTDTLPQGQEADLFHSKHGLVKRYQELTANINIVENELLRCSKDEPSVSLEVPQYGQFRLFNGHASQGDKAHGFGEGFSPVQDALKNCTI